MQHRFHSKIGWEIWLPVGAILALISMIMLNGGAWPGLFVVLSVVLFIIHLIKTTYYIIEGDHLIINCGFIYRQTIEIKSIKSVSESRNPLSSPALSLDRLGIKNVTGHYVLVSPKDKKGFVEALIKINPTIEVKLRTAGI